MILPGGNGHAESGVKHQKSIFGNGHDAKEEMVIKYINISSFQKQSVLIEAACLPNFNAPHSHITRLPVNGIQSPINPISKQLGLISFNENVDIKFSAHDVFLE